jgi:phosphate starvation-inducible PhoH-like protein
MGTQGNQGRQGNGRREFNDQSGNGASRGSRPSTGDNTPRFTPEQLVAQVASRLPSLGAGSLKIGKEDIRPTDNQKKLMHTLKNKDVTFVDGPLGTGKTFWTVYTGLQMLADGDVSKIALTAPVVEADENLGYLKGTKDEKMEQHVNQILETLDELIGKALRQNLVEAGVVEIAPHAFNRGRTYKNTFYILDECQNASARQLMTSIGRLGFNSKFVYMGDDRQNDRTAGKSAYVAFMQRFNTEAYSREVGHVVLDGNDVRRHPLLLKMVQRGDDRPLDGFEDRKDSKIVQSTKHSQSVQPS